MKNQNDIIKLANQMHKERDLQSHIAHESPETDVNRFERSFNEIFLGDETFERAPKHKTSVEIHSDYDHSIHDF